MNAISRFYLPIGGFALTVALGFWVSKVGRPYNGFLFNIHKLIALGTVIIISMRMHEVLEDTPIQALMIGLVVVTGLAVVALFVSGAFLSIGNVKYELVILIHNAAPIVAAIAMGVVIFLLTGRLGNV